MADLLATWGVVLEPDDADGEGRGSAAGWFAAGRDALFARCLRLAGFLQAENAALRVTAEQVPLLSVPIQGGVRVGVSVSEVRPSSFDMAVRIRATGADTSQPANGRCAVVIERRPTGERIPIPREVRDEFIALQLAARDLC